MTHQPHPMKEGEEKLNASTTSSCDHPVLEAYFHGQADGTQYTECRKCGLISDFRPSPLPTEWDWATEKKGVTIYKRDGSVLVKTNMVTMKEAILANKSNLRGSDLSYSNLRGSDLSGSDLSGSDLRYSNLRYSNLRGSDLSGSNLRGSDLSGSDLSGSNLRGTELQGAKFYGKEGTTRIKKSQLNDFMKALGVIVE